MTEELELTLFQIITAAGGSKSNYIGAIQLAKEGKFDEAEQLVKDGDEFLSQAHDPHAKLLAQEAQLAVEGKNSADLVCLLLIHAEDQMMSCEVFKQMAVEFIEIYKTR
ncbi:MAG: PTS lactose/cellobiose transporter subunit IIA [Coriobacteriales bacterium]|nr:PTS lactose/cellobiose transporter subunit IIA [Coriobacteriales bacterium]